VWSDSVLVRSGRKGASFAGFGSGGSFAGSGDFIEEAAERTASSTVAAVLWRCAADLDNITLCDALL
jgi:hypothetical protein